MSGVVPPDAEGAMVGLLLLVLFVGFVLLVPLLIVGLALRIAFGILLLPFKLAGVALKLTAGLVAGVVGVVLGAVALLAVLLVTGAVLIIPFVPLAIVAGGAWLIWRLARRRPAPGLGAV
jgi:hypothetical protein